MKQNLRLLFLLSQGISTFGVKFLTLVTLESKTKQKVSIYEKSRFVNIATLNLASEPDCREEGAAI